MKWIIQRKLTSVQHCLWSTMIWFPYCWHFQSLLRFTGRKQSSVYFLAANKRNKSKASTSLDRLPGVFVRDDQSCLVCISVHFCRICWKICIFLLRGVISQMHSLFIEAAVSCRTLDVGDMELCFRTQENSLSECHTYLKCKGLNLGTQ